MKTSVYLVLKYWRKHKKNLAALIFSGVLLTALVFVTLILQREVCVRGLDDRRNGQGAFDIIMSNSNDELLAKVTEGKTMYTYGYINVLGEMGSPTARFLYGTIHDEHNLYHPPLDEGRMPETSSEIVTDTDTLSELYWVGKCGETITLDGETYTVTGIINSRKWERYGVEKDWSYDPKLPTIFIGESDKTPLYRVDFLGDYYIDKLLPGMDELSKELDDGRQAYASFLDEFIDVNSQWIYCNYDYYSKIQAGRLFDADNIDFFMFTAYIGIIIAVLSVFSVIRSVFAERDGWMAMLRRIGAGRGTVAWFYVAECGVFIVLQTVIGLLAGLAVYGGIFAYKVNVLGEKAFSGFSTHYIVARHTRDPFLFAVLISIAVVVPAYLLCVLTSKLKARKLGKVKKPRSLSRCLGRTLARGSVTVVQTAALALICFSVVMEYLYYTRSNKEEMRIWLVMPFEVEDYTAGDIDMNEEGVAEYYYCSSPVPTGIGHQDADQTQYFMSVNPDETKGFGDDTAAKLPEGTVSTGKMEYLFIAADEPVFGYGKEIDLSNEIVRGLFIQTSSEKYKNFFDEGQLGSKHLYQAPTRLADVGTISKLSEHIRSGEINTDAINSGKEILVTYTDIAPPYSAGDNVTLYMSEANTEGYGVGNITSAEVTVGAVLQIPWDASEVIRKAARDKKRDYNFLTTSTGAMAMGAPCFTYSEAYAYEEVTGAPFPLSAEVSMTSLKELKHEIFVNRMKRFGGIALTLLIMSLLGFSAYFNGIGMKIRAKKYEISVMRAVGTPVTAIRKRLLLGSLKIPLIASAISYGMVRAAQLIMGKLGAWYMEQYAIYQDMRLEALHTLTDNMTLSEELAHLKESDALLENLRFAKKHFFLSNGMWNPKAEIPTLILFAVLCAVTFILTAIALKKFRGNIAGDLNEGRKRR